MMLKENKTALALDELAIDLGKEGAVSYVHFALPHLVERCDSLIALLIKEHWKEASVLAHKTLGSVRVYGVTSFESRLILIQTQAVEKISQPIFKQMFQESVQQLLADIEGWLPYQKPKDSHNTL